VSNMRVILILCVRLTEKYFLGTLNVKGNFTYSHADALFMAWTVAPSVGLFNKLTTKPTKPSKQTEK
jgi:hypothetical protein